MKLSKSELFYAFLSLILMVTIAFLYLQFGKRHTQTQVKTSPTTTQTQKSESTTNEPNLAAAEEALKTAEAELTQANLDNAEKAIDQLENETNKTVLKEKLANLTNERQAQDTANNALALVESNVTTDNIIAAQTAIDKLTNQTQKDQLQARLDNLKNSFGIAPDAYR